MNKVIRNSIALISSQIAGRIVAFVFVILIARYLGTEEFGKYSFVMAFIMIPAILVDFGMDRLLIREVARDKGKYPVYLYNTLLVKVVISAVMIAVVYLAVSCTEIARDREKAVCLMVFSFSIMFNSVQQTLWAVSDAYEKMQYHSLLFFAWNLLRGAIGIAALLCGLGLVALFKGLLIAEVLNTLLSLAVISKKFGIPGPRIESVFMSYLFKAALPFGLIQIFSTLYHRIDTILLSVMKGDAVVGWYSAAHTLTLTLLFIPTSITAAVFPHISQFCGKSEEQFRKTFDDTAKYLIILAFPIAIATTILSERVIALFYGNGYANSSVPLKILVWSQALAFPNCLLGTALLAVNREKQFSLVLVLGTLLNIGLNCLLIPEMSYNGAAVSKAAFEVFVFCGCSYFLYGLFSCVPMLRISARVIFACMIMSAFIFGFYRMPFVPLVLFASVLYLLALSAVGTFNREELETLRGMFRK